MGHVYIERDEFDQYRAAMRKKTERMQDTIEDLTQRVEELEEQLADVETEAQVKTNGGISKKDLCKEIAADEVTRKSDNYGEKAVIEAPWIADLAERELESRGHQDTSIHPQTVHDALQDLAKTVDILEFHKGRTGQHTENTRITVSPS